MKKFILLTTSLFLFSCSVAEMNEQDDLTKELESAVLSTEDTSQKTNSLTSKDTDNDGINDVADADVDGDGELDNGKDDDGDGINNLSDVDVDNDGVEDNGTDIDNDGINNENDDDIDGDGISNEDDEYQNLSDTSLTRAVQEKITNYINTNYTGKTITEVEIENQIIEIELSSDVSLRFDLNGNFLSFDNENNNDSDDSNDSDNDNDNDDSDDDENEYTSLSSSNLSASVQQKIDTYISFNYAGQTIVEVEVENQKIEIELSNDVELIFDLNGNFLKLDN